MQRIEAAACLFIPAPGPKMIWQFGELGYDVSLFSTADKTAAKPILWDYFQVGPRKWLYNVYAALINMKKQYSVFQTGTIYTDAGDNLRLSLEQHRILIRTRRWPARVHMLPTHRR